MWFMLKPDRVNKNRQWSLEISSDKLRKIHRAENKIEILCWNILVLSLNSSLEGKIGKHREQKKSPPTFQRGGKKNSI